MAEITLSLNYPLFTSVPRALDAFHICRAYLGLNENQDKHKHEEENEGNLDEIEDMVEDEDTACQLCIQVGQRTRLIQDWVVLRPLQE